MKWRYKILRCLLILSFLFPIVATTTVSRVSAETRFEDKFIVMYQGVVENTQIDKVQKGAELGFVGFSSVAPAKTLTEAVVCGESEQSEYYCQYDYENKNNPVPENELYPVVAILKMSSDGDIVINSVRARETTIKSLNIFYIVNDSANDKLLFCQYNEICPKAKIVSSDSQKSNWRNSAKSGTFNITNSDVESYFSVSTNDTRVTYSGFNVFNNMNTEQALLAKEKGVYVLISMQVSFKYNDNEIPISTYPNLYSEDIKFTGFKDEESKNVVYTTISNDGQQYYKVNQNAALIKPGNESSFDPNDSAAYREFKDFFDGTLRYIIIAVIGVMFLVTGSMTVVTIVKSSDEPEVRSSSIKKLIALFTGALTVALILLFYNQIIDIVSGWFG